MGIEEVIKLINKDCRKDLHIHSAFSDGILEPDEILKKWKSDGVELISITDHDGIEGSKIACELADEIGIKVIPGIEFDSEDALGKKLHILGYGMDFDNVDFLAAVEQARIWRDERNKAMERELNKLDGMEHDITEDEINAINGGRYVGKPTYSRILIKRGVAKDSTEVFDKIFRDNEVIRAFHKKTLSSKAVVDVIHKAGGIAILAHPIEQLRRGESFESFEPRLIELLDKFREYGIDGIECRHPSAGEPQEQFLREYAKKHALLITEGSDYHGEDVKRDFSRYHR